MDQQQQRTSGIPVTLPPMGTATVEQNAAKSLTHWVITLYRDINNMAPWGIKSQLGYRDQRWTELKRCTPYPLGNLVSYDVDREAAELNAGFNTNAETLPKVEYIKYAQDQAKELADSYAKDGLRILTPLLGMDDAELVNQIVQVVQPFAYAIHEMRYEFTEGAEKRIRASNLSAEDRKKARDLAKILLNGATDPLGSAEVKAKAEYDILIASMSDKRMGGPGIANPTPFHEWICQQLDKPVPRQLDLTGSQQQPVAGTDPVLMKAVFDQQKQIAEMQAQMKFQKNKSPKKQQHRPAAPRSDEVQPAQSVEG